MLFLGGLLSISSSRELPRPTSLFPRIEEGAKLEFMAGGPSVDARGPGASIEIALDRH